jgi:hypothetical protein
MAENLGTSAGTPTATSWLGPELPLMLYAKEGVTWVVLRNNEVSVGFLHELFYM